MPKSTKPAAATELAKQVASAIAHKRGDKLYPAIQVRLQQQDHDDLQMLIKQTGARSAAEVLRNLIRAAAGRI